MRRCSGVPAKVPAVSVCTSGSDTPKRFTRRSIVSRSAAIESVTSAPWIAERSAWYVSSVPPERSRPSLNGRHECNCEEYTNQPMPAPRRRMSTAIRRRCAIGQKYTHLLDFWYIDNNLLSVSVFLH